MNEPFLVRLLRAAVRRPRFTLLLWAFVGAILAPGVARLEISTSTDDVLDRHGPQWALYQSSLQEFGGDEVLVAALRSDKPFDQSVLTRVVRLSDELARIPGVRRVDSLSTVPLIRLNKDGVLDLSPALHDVVPNSREELRELKRAVLSDRVAPETLISKDAKTLALGMQLSANPPEGFDSVVREIRRVLRADDVWLSGVPVFRAEINRTAGVEIAKFVLFTVLAVGGVFFLVVRSLAAVLIILLVGSAGTWITLAALGISGTPLTLITVILPSLMLALGCAYSVHIIAAARGAVSAEQLVAAIGPVLAPTALSALTTAIGFLAVAAVRIDAIRQVGAYGALGVFSVGAAALTIVPAVLALRPLSSPPLRGELWLRESLPEVLFTLARQHGTSVIVGWAVLGAIFGLGVGRVSIETDVTRWFARGTDVRDSYDEIRSHLAGISPMNIVVRARDGEVTRPDVLDAIDGLTAYLNERDEIGKAVSVADPIRQMHVAFTGELDAELPQSHALISQYLLLLDSVSYMRDLLSSDRTAANVLVRADDNGSKDLLEVAGDAERWWSSNGPEATDAVVTGIMFEFARAEDEIALGQIKGLASAVVVIMVLMLLIYRSPRLSAFAMVPNVLPLIVVFGFLGLAGLPMDAGIVVSSCLVLGIAVDDTLHLMSAYRDEIVGGGDRNASLRVALARVANPLVLTSLALGIGFAVLGFSSFAFVRNLGILVGAIMVVCLLADTTLLPALLARFGGSRRG